MRKVVTGEELAQIYNSDPFAMPRWRAPVYRTPFGIILAAKLFKLLLDVASAPVWHRLITWLVWATVLVTAWSGVRSPGHARARSRPSRPTSRRRRARWVVAGWPWGRPS